MIRGVGAAFAAAVGVIVVLASPGVQAEEWNWTNPVIKDYGPVVPRPDAALQPDKNADYKVVFNVTAWATPDKVEPGLERVARAVNLFASAGVDDLLNSQIRDTRSNKLISGRDYFLGGGIYFTDDDLKAILTTTGVPSP